MTNQKNVTEQTNTQTQQNGNIKTKSETIRITITVDVDRTKYKQFRRMFDQQSWIEFVDYCINSGHLDEVLGENPELMAEFVKAQNERLYGKMQEA